MLIFPAIDLKDGRAVRLRQGSFDTACQVAEDPLAAAAAFRAAGAAYVHVVDLDGARDGARKNAAIARAVAETGLKMELGGGIRAMADLEAAFDLGAWRAVIGSAAVTDPAFVEAALEKYGPERVAVGIDARDGLVRTAGWTENAGLHYIGFAKRMEAMGVEYIIFTDIGADGMLSGPSFGQLRALQDAVGCAITASGGVSSNADLRALRDQGVYAAIVGKAWYAGAVDLALAVREGGAQ